MNNIILESLIDDLVIVNLILFNEGVLDVFGYVSVRNFYNRDYFFLVWNMVLGFVIKDDILEFNFDGEVVNDDFRKVYLECYIYSEIYWEWDDVEVIVYSYFYFVVLFSVVKFVFLKFMCYMSGFMGIYVFIFEICDVVGDEINMLIIS